MIQVSIKRSGQLTNQASFPTMEEAQAWLASHEGMGTFGQKAQTIQQEVEVSPAVFDEEGNEITPAQHEMQEIHIPGYVVEIEDISDELEQEQINKEAQAFLAETDFKVLRHIRQKALGQQLSLSEEEYLALEQQRADAAARIVK
jgi:hypothetical protein